MNKFGVYIPYNIFQKLGKQNFVCRHVGFNKSVTQILGYIYDKKTKMVSCAHMKAIELLEDNGINIPQCHISDGQPIIVRDPCPLSLRPHQVKTVEWLQQNIFTKERINDGIASCNMQLKTGLGKTFVAMKFIKIFSVKTLIILPANLIPQWAAAITTWMPTIHIGYYSGKKKTDGHVILASSDSLLKPTFKFKALNKKWYTVTSKVYFSQFGFTVIDEIQTICTERKSVIFRKARSLRTLAMSGTCNHRLDKMDKIAHLYLGDPIIMINEIPSMEAIVNMSHIVVDAYKVCYYGPDEYTHTITMQVDGKSVVSNPLMINQFVKDPYRTKLIVNKAKWCVEHGHATFIFLDRVELIDALIPIIKSELGNIGIDAPESKVYSVQGKSKQEERDNAKHKGMICLLTYACGSVGLSYSRYTASIFASPRRNGFLQTNNRIFRLDSPQNKGRILIYIVDMLTPTRSQYAGFRKSLKAEYKQTTWHIEDYNWNNDELCMQYIKNEWVSCSKNIRQIIVEYMMPL